MSAFKAFGRLRCSENLSATGTRRAIVDHPVLSDLVVVRFPDAGHFLVHFDERTIQFVKRQFASRQIMPLHELFRRNESI